MKQLILMGVSLLLFGCGIIGGALHNVGYGDWASDVDISNSFNVATIRGGSRPLVTTYVTCLINQPVKTRKLTFNAGRMRVAVRCTAWGQTYRAYFYFEAIPGHDYLIHMRFARRNRSIDLIDETDDGSVIDSSRF